MLRRKKSKTEVVLDRASDLAESAQERVRDDIFPAVATALESIGDSDDDAKPKKKKKSKLKKLVILAGLGGAVFFVTKKLKGGSNGAPVPPPAPAPTPTQPVDSATQETPAPEQTPSA